MREKWLLLGASLVVIAGLIFTSGTVAATQAARQLNKPDTRDTQQMERLKEEVRHQLVMLPYYSVFDWLQAEVKPDGTVALMGEVTRPSTKDDAETSVKRLEAATNVVNNIKVLPVSTMDDRLRVALYRSLFRYNSPLFRYGIQSVPSIHIIVENGHVTLKGIVANQMDSQLAQMAANGVSGVFEVKNELQIEERTDEKVSRK
jgi:hyperosmotically inducible protein